MRVHDTLTAEKGGEDFCETSALRLSDLGSFWVSSSAANSSLGLLA